MNDQICPPVSGPMWRQDSTAQADTNHYPSATGLVVYPMIDHRGHTYNDREPATPCQHCGLPYGELFAQTQSGILMDCTKAESDRIWELIRSAAMT
jgi:hypothetical protein